MSLRGSWKRKMSAVGHCKEIRKYEGLKEEANDRASWKSEICGSSHGMCCHAKHLIIFFCGGGKHIMHHQETSDWSHGVWGLSPIKKPPLIRQVPLWTIALVISRWCLVFSLLGSYIVVFFFTMWVGLMPTSSTANHLQKGHHLVWFLSASEQDACDITVIVIIMMMIEWFNGILNCKTVMMIFMNIAYVYKVNKNVTLKVDSNVCLLYTSRCV